MRIIYLIILALFGTTACGPQSETSKQMDTPYAPYLEQATKIAKETIIFDGHIDFPTRYIGDSLKVDPTKRLPDGDYDLVRAKEGGLDAPFMAIYVGASHQQADEGSGGRKDADAYDYAMRLINMMDSIAAKHPDHVKIAMSPEDVRENFKKGIQSWPYGMENGAPIEGSLDKLREFYKRGIRYITLTHSQWNHISDSSYDDDKHWGGLSPFGRQVVQEMNKLGMLVDISHVSDSTFYQVIRMVKAPVIASHSSARKFTPGFERNMNDDMIKALAKNGGIIMINFGSSFVTEKANIYRGMLRDSVAAVAKSRGIDIEKNRAAGWRIYQEMQGKFPYPYATLEEVADHIDHVKSLVGIDHIGLGSDYDGVGDSLPIGLKDASTYPALFAELLRRGYTESDIKKICSENFFRVWETNIKMAAQSSNP